MMTWAKENSHNRSIMRALISFSLLGSLSLCGLIILPDLAEATDFTAQKVMTEMTTAQRYSFVAGVVEGLAYARYSNDNKSTSGMECIYDWFYKEPQTDMLIYTAFEKYPTYPPGAIIASLLKKKCN